MKMIDLFASFNMTRAGNNKIQAFYSDAVVAKRAEWMNVLQQVLNSK